ncbi:phosphopantetheine-binding protein [Alkalilimnicola sp. S0819]|uniref:phosphopantetheine-binding protein n=1 Tax=Alkalilimnicola sp. S0819 TaxID=2613922 RepID=UPI001261B86E|nr:phosphopantetheine-binding protein [Alkalilimnicola sp. S0819]KAB7624175.1 acyl carrier protein [Alkalilimnicola sp. S0819]MPQ16429.1 acyl carrier protein [Alkalilimnicola sp. S0819]
MSTLSALELEVAQLIVDTLNLEDVEAAEVDPEEPLFGDGLGLDSIDALELALAISRQYGFQLRADDADTQQAFGSLRALCQLIEARRAN